MGMSTHVIGFRSRESEDFKKHEKVLRACIEAGIAELPEETAEYFGDSDQNEYLLEEALQIDISDCTEEYQGDMKDGYEIKVKDIPEGVDIIRVYNSY